MENVVFKQSLMGFDRQQVLNFIDTLAAQLKTQEQEYTEKQERLENEINSLSDNLATSSENLKAATEKIQALSAELEEFKHSSIEIKNQINTYRNLLLEKDREIVEIKSNYNDLANQRDSLEQDNLVWQSKQNEIASCLVDANVKAKEIINSATLKAQQTKEEFDANAGQLFDKVEDVKSEIARVEEQLEVSFQKLKTAMEAMDDSSKVIEEQVLSYRQQVSTLDVKLQEGENQADRAQEKATTATVPNLKKTLTDNVLDTILKLLEK